MLNKNTAAAIEEIARTVELKEYDDIKFLARDLARQIDANKSKDNMLWIMCLRLTAQIMVDAQKSKLRVDKYLAKEKIFT